MRLQVTGDIPKSHLYRVTCNLMRFPQIEQLALPCHFERVVPGALHSDGRRYLPQIVLKLDWGEHNGEPRIAELGVVDRHHRVEQALAGRDGMAKLVLLLSKIRLQEQPGQLGMFPEGKTGPGVSTRPVAYGRVLAVPTWETEREQLPYETLYTELLLEIGIGVVGVRTSATAADLSAAIGKPQIEPGDWLQVERSRIDILAFEPND